MTGVIDVGGGMRGIFGAGVFDYCLDNGIAFDYCIGVSAGSANAAAYLAGQRGRNYKFYHEYAFRRQYMGLGNFLHKGSFIDLDYVYGSLSNRDGENPLNFDMFRKSAAKMKVVALNALTGRTIYFDKGDMMQDDYKILKASSCIPVVCRPYFVNGIPCYDGGLADPVPLKKALADGCDRVVVILTKPREFLRSQRSDMRLARILRRKYPKAAEQLLLRYRKYNRGVTLAKVYEKEGKALILAPDSINGMNTLTKDRDSMDRLYRKGYAAAAAIPEFLQKEAAD
jgi:predicted patatin/cPLA2 family phospholipase